MRLNISLNREENLLFQAQPLAAKLPSNDYSEWIELGHNFIKQEMSTYVNITTIIKTYKYSKKVFEIHRNNSLVDRAMVK